MEMVSTKTDENIYMDPPSRFYLTKIIKAKVTDSKKKTYNSKISIGNLILEINGKVPKNLKEFYEIIENNKDKEFLNFKFIDVKDVNKNYRTNGFYSPKNARVKIKDIPEDFILYLNSAVLICYIEKNGKSDRAGIKVGDYIVKVNGSSFKAAIEAHGFIQQGEAGSIMVYDVLRENKFFESKVEIAKYQITINYLLLFIIGLIYIILGLVIALSRTNFRIARLLGWSFILIGYYLSAMMIPMRTSGLFQYHVYFLYGFTPILGFSLLTSALAGFPRVRDDLIKTNWVTKSPYIFGILLFLLAISNIIFIESSTLNTAILIVFQLYFPIFLIYYFIVLLIFKKHRSPEESKLSQPINMAFLLTLLLACCTFTGTIFAITYFTPYYLISLGLIPFAFVYTIGRYKLLGIEFKIRKNIQYIIVATIWKVLLLSFIFLIVWSVSQVQIIIPNLHFTGTSIEVLDNELSKEKQDFYHNILIIIFSISGALIFKRINTWGQKLLDKKYYRTRFDYKKAASDFSEILEKNINIEDIAKNIINELSILVHLKNSGIVFYKNEKLIYTQNFHGFNGDSITEYCRVTAQKQLAYLKQYKTELSVEYLDEPMKEIYQKCNFRYIIPIRSKDKILGALYVGEKLSETPYTREDLDFLNTIAGQISVAVENAFLYEELASQERIKHELNLARKIQLASLPSKIPDTQGLDVSGLSVPAFEVGGDFYDFLSNNGELSVIVGDVSGKGTSAALYMSKAQGIMRTLYEFNLSPKEMFVKSNQLLFKYLEKNSFITAICTTFNTDKKEIKISRAGHLPLYYYDAAKKQVEVIQSKGIVLGMTKSDLFEIHLEERLMNYSKDDVLIFVTDGVLEARNNYGIDFTQESLLVLINQICHLNSEQIRNKILETVKEFAGSSEQFDDMTVVVVKAE
jgi:serine phosphatase RsbU (regulator of sigma subunit)